jgi:hypothetical protein
MEFLDVIRTTDLSVFLHAISSRLHYRRVGQKWLNWFVNIVYGKLKSDNSQDYAKKPQQNCTLMNPALDF